MANELRRPLILVQREHFQECYEIRSNLPQEVFSLAALHLNVHNRRLSLRTTCHVIKPDTPSAGPLRSTELIREFAADPTTPDGSFRSVSPTTSDRNLRREKFQRLPRSTAAFPAEMHGSRCPARFHATAAADSIERPRSPYMFDLRYAFSISQAGPLAASAGSCSPLRLSLHH